MQLDLCKHNIDKAMVDGLCTLFEIQMCLWLCQVGRRALRLGDVPGRSALRLAIAVAPLPAAAIDPCAVRLRERLLSR